MYRPIKSREVALSTIKDTSTVFFILAVVLLLVVYIKFPPGLELQFIESLIYAVLAAMVLELKSRAAAVLLFIQSGGGFIFLTYSWLTIPNNEFSYTYGPRIILALILTYTAIRAVQATYLLHGKFNQV
ncbi:MAG: hypothetical protein OQL16_06865 [Gammaproteobacteria bacterium]|nr:hypothetical protein [Gammaproteobacteria bacterium]